ncbi:hypothetical protein KAI56_02385 [Candidatus Parcubacteria bacterium]|nr:hypothetical protein [Candidatus Parcubacteria bacterium]
MKKLTDIIKEYLPDILFIVGVYVFSYNFLRPTETTGILKLKTVFTDYHTEEKVLGIVLIAIGIDIAVRRYISYKNKQKTK